MQNVTIYTATISVGLDIGPDICDVTSRFDQVIQESGIDQGHLSACIMGSTGSLTTIEFEPGVVKDLKRAITSLAPPGLKYEHELAWHDGNGHSHVQAALLGPSIDLPVRNGRLKLGTWQQVVAVNHDNRPRTRKIEITICGKI